MLTPIAYIRSPFSDKFGIPRQSNIVCDVVSTVVFEPEFRNVDAIRGIEDFDYIWLIWQFSENLRDGWTPTVRPPRLGGNKRLGVFATRSPFRPNALGLSSVRLLGVELSPVKGPLLHVGGADLKDGTPIFDIKPYVPYADSHPDARGGFASEAPEARLEVCYDESQIAVIPEPMRKPLMEILSSDPRPSYHNDPNRVYGFFFCDHEVKFKVLDNNRLEVVNIF